MSVVLSLTAVLTGVVFVVAGVFSVLALLLGDLLESDPQEPPGGEWSEAARAHR